MANICRQGRRQGAGPGGRACAARIAGLTGLVLLGGCSAAPEYFHRAEGGEIAKPHAPPPGINQPYPNLASVPARPTPPDQAALQRISQSLVADRANAQHLMMPAPADPSLPSTSPSLFGIGTAPPPPAAAPAASATLAAAQASPAAAQAPPATARPTAAPASVRTPSLPAPAVQPTVPVPVIPAGPPAPPQVASLNPEPGPGGTPFPNVDYGGAPPGATTAAHSPAQPPNGAVAANASPTGPAPIPPASLRGPPPPPGAPTLPANPATTVDVPFAPASAILPAEAASALRDLARRRGQHAIVVIGRGDATSANPELQSQALSLALRRAQAIAQMLAADGVPEAAIRIDSQANGRGGAARVVE